MWNKLKQNSWLVRNIAFLIIFVQLFMAVSYILRPSKYNASDIVTGFYYQEKNSLDVVCIGASSIYRFWTPLNAWNDFGFTSYNFSISAMPTESILPSIKEVLEYQDPEILILDLRKFGSNQYTINLNRFIQYSDSLKYSMLRTNFIINIVPERIKEGEDTDIFNYIFDIGRYHINWKLLSDESILRYNNEKYNAYKGTVISNDFDKEHVTFRDVSNIDDVIQPNEYTKQLFEDILDYISTIDCNVLFLVSPYNETENNRKFFNYYEQRILETGFQYINTNDYLEEINLTNYSQYFYDESHVNIFGAEKFTNFLGNYLIENYDLPDKRNSPNYSYWHDDYVLWEIDSENTKLAISKILNE